MTKWMVPVFITQNAGMVSFKGLAVRKSATILVTAVTKIVAIFRSGGAGEEAGSGGLRERRFANEIAAFLAGEAAGEGKAEADAGLGFGGFAGRFVEGTGELVGEDAGAVVGDVDFDFVRDVVCLDIDNGIRIKSSSLCHINPLSGCFFETSINFLLEHRLLLSGLKTLAHAFDGRFREIQAADPYEKEPVDGHPWFPFRQIAESNAHFCDLIRWKESNHIVDSLVQILNRRVLPDESVTQPNR